MNGAGAAGAAGAGGVTSFIPRAEQSGFYRRDKLVCPGAESLGTFEHQQSASPFVNYISTQNALSLLESVSF
jgi:hypothetical protein